VPTSPTRATGLDLLRLPLLGRLLRARHARLVFQVPLLLLSVLLVWHGLAGPQLAPRNLATLLTWVHWRGLLVLGLLVAGNVFCLACPFLLPREAARKLFRPPFTWPAALRSKWIAAALLVALLFAYELFDLWASPWATAWLVVAYFAAALLVDALFQGASFCKWVCPIGQFNFVASTSSPVEVRVRDEDTCARCTTHDCIDGRPDDPALRGCELGLYLPRKVGNLDCTFCLDCVHACPHDNVALAARLPAEELWDDRSGAGIGRPRARADFSLLATLFVFGALLNAFGMVSPVYAVQSWIAVRLGLQGEAPVLAVLFAACLVVEPVVLLGLAAAACRRAARIAEPLPALVLRFAWGLVPLGFGVWLAHYSFHLLTGLLTIVPVTQSAAIDLFGRPLLGAPAWGVPGLSAVAVRPLETGFLALGLLVSLGVTWRLAAQAAPARTRGAFAPWAVLLVLLFVAALWLVAQPMEMRGTFLDG
jgi:polyferredoxin